MGVQWKIVILIAIMAGRQVSSTRSFKVTPKPRACQNCRWIAVAFRRFIHAHSHSHTHTHTHSLAHSLTQTRTDSRSNSTATHAHMQSLQWSRRSLDACRTHFPSLPVVRQDPRRVLARLESAWRAFQRLLKVRKGSQRLQLESSKLGNSSFCAAEHE